MYIEVGLVPLLFLYAALCHVLAGVYAHRQERVLSCLLYIMVVIFLLSGIVGILLPITGGAFIE